MVEMEDSEFELELKQDFLTESEDLLRDAENAFLRIEVGGDNAELFNEIFRLAHNLKGTSKAVGFDQLSELTHVAENLILKLKEAQVEVTDNLISVLLVFKDKIHEMIEGLKANTEATFEIESIKSKLESATNQEERLVSVSVSVDVVATDDELRSDEIPSADYFEETFIEINIAALESLKECHLDLDEELVASIKSQEQILPCMNDEIKEVKEEVAPKPSSKGSGAVAESDESIRVKLSRIDEINNVIGELVILHTGLYQRRFECIKDDLSNKSIGMMGKLFKEVQELAMSLRMLPLKSTFQKMSRVVRDTSKVLDKEIKLHLVGEETEVDKTVLEKLSDPLVHIVRNAVDHGLESSAERKAANKDVVGNVELMAYHEGSNLVIQVTDDGRGIDPEVIKKKAIEKGILDEYTKMSPQEIIQLIFYPGFSTKEHVSEVSGRGVGMDVVKTNIELLGGEVKLMSKLGEGTSLKIVLPLTLAIIEGIIIRSCADRFVVPLNQIYEIVQLKSEDVEQFSGMASLFKLRGEVLPLFYLNHKLGTNSENEDRNTVIVVRGLSHAFGVVVDDILIQQQIVIKKLGEDIRSKKGIMGSAIMADGKPALILDFFELFRDDLKSNRSFKNYLKDQDISA